MLEDKKMDIKNIDCTKCSELVKSRKRITWGYGDDKSPVVFVGEAPGRFGCDITGVPFTKDRSGELFQEMLRAVGLTKNDVYVTNIVKCCPPNNRTPGIIETGNCMPYFRYELDVIKPKYLVLLGATAVQILLPTIESVIANWNKILKYQEHECIILPHPAWICRNMQLKNKYIDSFKNIRRIVYGEQEYHRPNTEENIF